MNASIELGRPINQREQFADIVKAENESSTSPDKQQPSLIRFGVLTVGRLRTGSLLLQLDFLVIPSGNGLNVRMIPTCQLVWRLFFIAISQ